MDKVFLLSIDEAEEYFENDKARVIGSLWWLRSPALYSRKIVGVYWDGHIYRNGLDVFDEHSVRPALWINLES